MRRQDTKRSTRNLSDTLALTGGRLLGTSIPTLTADLPSRFRLLAAFTAFVVCGVLALSLFVFLLVSRVSGEIVPTVRSSLEWKANEGPGHIADTVGLGVLLEDSTSLRTRMQRFVLDPDLRSVTVVDRTGRVVFEHGSHPEPLADSFRSPARSLRDSPTHYLSWADAIVARQPVGRVALSVSKARLLAAIELERNILMTTAVAAVLALLAAFAFAKFYIAPLLQRLEQTTLAALDAARLKGEFLANMSHEIRTPMNGVLGMIELLRGTALDQKQTRYASTLQTSANALMSVLNDVLDFSKIEAGKLDIVPIPCKVRTLAEEVTDLFAARARVKGIELACHVQATAPAWVLADKDRLRQVLSNLLGNAVKFTDEGEVVLRVSLTSLIGKQALLRFEVSDTGIGIALAQRERLFHAFSQVDGSATRKYGGTGLGLSICQRLVTLMAGRIGVESHERRGSTFWFELPLAVLENTDRNEGRGPEHRVRTLVVDDNATNLIIFEELLKSWEVPCRTATNAAEALSEVESAAERQEPIELAICDLKMPEVDGVELARILRERHSLPVILVASLGPDAVGSGGPFDAVLRKPVRGSDLARLMDRVIDGLGDHTLPPQAEGVPSAKLVPARLLVAEDNPINQEVLLELLRALGFRADLVDSGRRAVEATALEDYAMVLMDCQMPDLDGYAATRLIRAREAGTSRRLPIIAVTAHALLGDSERAFAAGMDDYLTKPIDREALDRMLKRWVKGRESMVPTQALAVDPTVARSKTVESLFLQHAPRQIERIRSAIDSADPASIREAAHLLKGSCLAFGAPGMASVCRALESNPSDKHALCRELDQCYAAVVRALQSTESPAH